MRAVLAAICIAQASLAQAECFAIPNPYIAGFNTICAPGLQMFPGVPAAPVTRRRANPPSELEMRQRPLVSTPLQDQPIGVGQ